jgi:hypothetical protein
MLQSTWETKVSRIDPEAVSCPDIAGIEATAFKDEPAELADLIVKKAGSTDAEFPRFVAHRFYRPFRHSISSAPKYGLAFSAISVLVIGAGLASSALASANQANTPFVVALGLLVAVAAAVNRLWRPGLRGAIRHETANSLRREGWSFVCGRGEYAECTDQRGAFVDRVERINVKAENIDEQSQEASD